MKWPCFLSILLILSACGFTGDASRMGEGVLVVNNMAGVGTLDPGMQSSAEDQRLSLALFEGLCVPHPKTLKPLPGVAKSWSCSEDGLVYTFRLRSCLWSDGTPLTAQDFLYAWRRVLTPPGGGSGRVFADQRYYIAAPYADILHVIRRARGWHRGEVKSFDEVGIRVLADDVLQVTLERPTPWFLELLSFPTFFPVPRHVVEEFAADWTRPGHIVGNGPFVLKELRQGDLVRVAASETYWDRENVGLKGLVYLATDQIDTAIDQYLAGESDWVRSFNPKKVRAWRKDRELSRHLRAPQFLATFFLRMNLTHPVMKSRALRQALSLAVDREAITRYVTGLGELPATGLVPPYIDTAIPWQGGGTPGLRFDPERARGLLREAGYPGGRGLAPLTISFNTDIKNRAIAEAIQAMWKKELGIQVLLENREKRVHFARERALEYMLSRGNWIGDFSDPTTFLDVFRSDGGSNRTGWKNKTYDDLLDAALLEGDTKKRFELLRRAEHILVVDDPAIIPIFYYRTAYLLRPGKFDGLHENSRNIHPPKFIRPRAS